MQSLMGCRFLFTYGFKNSIEKYYLEFTEKDFFHMAGFQYLNDLPLRKYNKNKYLNKVLEKEITYEIISKSENFKKMVLPRLKGIIELKKLLYSEFKTYKFNSRVLNFHTDISAKFLLTNKEMSVVVFLFLDDEIEHFEEPKKLFCRSVFTESKNRDYSKNQKAIRIMYKEVAGKDNYVF